MFDSLIAGLLERAVLTDPLLERRLRLVQLDTAAVAIAALQVPLLVDLQLRRARLEPGRMLLLGMITGLNPMASASLRPALAVVPVVLALAHHDGRNLAGA